MKVIEACNLIFKKMRIDHETEKTSRFTKMFTQVAPGSDDCESERDSIPFQHTRLKRFPL
jgi:hypothetical protein